MMTEDMSITEEMCDQFSIFLMPIEALKISSTEIRHKSQRGESVSGLVPGPVESHIKKNGLYLKPQTKEKMTEKKSSKLSFRSLPREVQISIRAAQDKQSEDLTVLDLRKVTSFTDYFIITHGRSSRQNAAITEHIETELKKENIRPLNIEGRERGEWILMDYGFFIVHVFSSQARDYYSLEKLWGDAARMNC